MIGDFEAEDVENLGDRAKRGIGFAALNVFDRSDTNPCHFGEVLLRDAEHLAPLFHYKTKFHSIKYRTFAANLDKKFHICKQKYNILDLVMINRD